MTIEQRLIPSSVEPDNGRDIFPNPTADLRLRVALTAYDDYINQTLGIATTSRLERAELFKEHLKSLTPEQAAALCDDIGNFVAGAFAQTSEFHRDELLRGVRRTDPENLARHLQFVEAVKPEVGILEGQRHGDQELNDATRKLSGKARKIAQMRTPNNETDPTTPVSMVEAVKNGVATLWLLAKTGRQAQVESSQNLRSAQVAEIEAHILEVRVLYDPKWNCDNYPPNHVLSDEDIATELGTLDGSIPWTEEIIDKIFGKGRYRALIEMVARKKEEAYRRANALTISVGHSQALAAFGAQGRLGLLGTVAEEPNNFLQLTDGIFKAK